jgi:alpha-L-rhamnosidase
MKIPKRLIQPSRLGVCAGITLAGLAIISVSQSIAKPNQAGAIDTFLNPPASARPWVYWYFSDGNLTREGMKADLKSMKRAGIGGAIFLEVNIGERQGSVKFMSEPWQKLLKESVGDAERLGLALALGAGPGWCGSGGPWIQPAQAMQQLVASETNVTGPQKFSEALPQPKPRVPYFGTDPMSPAMKQQWQDYYEDVTVIAYPTPKGSYKLPDVDEKALYFRAPYSSVAGTKPRLTASAQELPADECIALKQVVELKSKMTPDGKLAWDVPAGDWTILRLGRTLTGQTTRPAPEPGLGWESGKFDKASFDAHFTPYFSTLLKKIGAPRGDGTGLTQLHFDSWEMSSQNWSAEFRQQFKALRGYDPAPYLPAMFGKPIGSVDVAERFLWDLRRTAQELVYQNHILPMKALGHQNKLLYSIEPYDMNPAGDLLLGGAGDVPMCEFWSQGYGFKSEYSCIEAVSAAHTNGRNLVAAESFTSEKDRWRQYPWAMKQQGDWALCAGINRFVFHRFAAQPTLDEKPGMTWGPYGVHWDRTQTWWEMAGSYHGYLTRCQALLRRGLPVADVLYLDVEDAPAVFTPPPSALLSGFPDRKGHSFDGCAPDTLVALAKAKSGQITFPDGMSYKLLVLPRVKTMSLPVLRKIAELVANGVTVVGAKPQQAPGLVGYPAADTEVKNLADKIWANKNVIEDSANEPGALYPEYDFTQKILQQKGIAPDFAATADLRYTHRHEPNAEIYLIGNRTDQPVKSRCTFRVTGKTPILLDPVSGEKRALPEFEDQAGGTTIPLEFAAAQSYFILFIDGQKAAGSNFQEWAIAKELNGPWAVRFDPKMGGPAQAVTFAKLEDWSASADDAIKHYSGVASYQQRFEATPELVNSKTMRLETGEVHAMAKVFLNDRELGVVWCAPWQLAIPPGLLKANGNTLRIDVANLWPNRLIGDANQPPEKRFAKIAVNPFKADEPLLPSGLVGPVSLSIPK